MRGAGSKKQEARGKRQEAGSQAERLLLGFGIGDWGFVICHLSFVILLLWRPLFAGEAFFWGTPLLQFVPWQRMAAAMWRGGHLPLWNSLAGCGAPLAANYQTAAFYPLSLLYLLLPAEVALSWTTALHLALAGWGMYGWCRVMGLDRFPAFIGALSLSGSGFLVARAALFPSMVFTFPWLAVWLWRAEVLVRRGRLHNALWLGLALGLGLLAGHAQTVSYGGLLLAAYLVFRTIQEARGRRQEAGSRKQKAGIRTPHITHHASRITFHVSRCWLLALLSFTLGVGLAAVQLLPTAELMSQSQRSTGVDYGFGMTYSLWPWHLITFAAPDFFGNPGQGDYWGYAAYWEDAGYVGGLPLLLAAGAVFGGKLGRQASRKTRGPGDQATRRGREGQVRFWAVSAVIALVLALGKNTPVFPFLFRHVPGFDWFQAPARWLAVTTVALAALVALGAQWWPAGHRGRRLGALGVVVGVALALGGLAAPRLVPSIPSTFGPATARLGGTLAVAGALPLLRRDATVRLGASRLSSTKELFGIPRDQVVGLPNLLGSPREEPEQVRDSDTSSTQTPKDPTRPNGEAWWRAAVGCFVALDLLLFGWPLMPTVDRSLYRDVTAAAIHLEYEPSPVARIYWPVDPLKPDSEYGAEYRVKFGYLTFNDFGPREVGYWWEMREALLPNVGMLDGVASANNFDPLLVGRYADLLEAAVKAPSLLRVMSVTHVASDRPWPGGQPIYASEPATLYRLPETLGRAWVVPAARQVSPDEMLAVLADPTFDPATEVLLEHPTSSIQHQASSIQRPASSIQHRVALQDASNRVTIRAALDAPGYLVLADTWYPGWQATVDGEPADILRANYAFRAVRLDAGEHTVEMIYRPTSVLVGGMVSLMALALLVVGLLWTARRERQV